MKLTKAQALVLIAVRDWPRRSASDLHTSGRTLETLRVAGLVKRASHLSSDRKAFTITDSGLAAIAQWVGTL